MLRIGIVESYIDPTPLLVREYLGLSDAGSDGNDKYKLTDLPRGKKIG